MGRRFAAEESRLLAWGLALLPFTLLALWHWPGGPGIGRGDYAQYLLHARALLEGRPYVDTAYIFNPYNWAIGPVAYPPGLPLTLAPVMALFGTSGIAFKVLMFAFALGFILISGRYFAVRENRWLGLGVVLMTGLSLQIVQTATQINSDLPFAFFLWTTIYLYDKPGDWGWGRVIAITVTGGLTLSYRLAGVALLPAALIFGLWQLRKRDVKALLPVVFWGVAGAGMLFLSPALLARAQGILADPLGYFVSPRIESFFWNLMRYRWGIASSHLYPLPGDTLNDIYHVLSGLTMVVGLIAWIKDRGSSFLLLFAVLYGAMLFFLLVDDPRYLWPLFPLMIFGLLNGVRQIVAWVGTRSVEVSSEGIALAFAALLALLVVPGALAEPRREALAERPEVRDLFGYLERRASEEDIRVLFVKPRVLAWETGIPAMGLFLLESQETDPSFSCDSGNLEYVEFLRAKGITHVVVGDLGLFAVLDDVLRRVVEACSSRFSSEFRNGAFDVYRLTAQSEPASDPGTDRNAGSRGGSSPISGS